jgi:dTDP-4-amino-4,6-dideoxygalactose transaminase
MQIVTFPPALIEAYAADVKRLLETGQVAEGAYFKELTTAYVPNRLSIPVASGGAGLFSLLAYHKHVSGRRLAIIQSNTMRALYTVPTLLEMKTLVLDSSYEDFMSLSPSALERALDDRQVREAGVVLYSVIGGFLAPSFARVAELCRRARVPLVVDGAHAHYLDAILAQPDVDIAYSFYATKVLPAGEGGLITTADRGRHDWLRRFLIYDRFDNQLEVGLNLRASELGAALIHRLMTDPAGAQHFKDDRIRIANAYRAVCEERGIRYLDQRAATDYNGYKFVVLDRFEDVERMGTPLTAHGRTSAVFDTDVLGRPSSLPHWCPPTYASLVARA